MTLWAAGVGLEVGERKCGWKSFVISVGYGGYRGKIWFLRELDIKIWWRWLPEPVAEGDAKLTRVRAEGRATRHWVLKLERITPFCMHAMALGGWGLGDTEASLSSPVLGANGGKCLRGQQIYC